MYEIRFRGKKMPLVYQNDYLYFILNRLIIDIPGLHILSYERAVFLPQTA